MMIGVIVGYGSILFCITLMALCLAFTYYRTSTIKPLLPIIAY